MYTPPKCISYEQQRILYQIYDHGTINFFSQNPIVFRNQRAFNRSMKIFVTLEWLEKRFKKINGYFANEYSITTEGRLVLNFSLIKVRENYVK